MNANTRIAIDDIQLAVAKTGFGHYMGALAEGLAPPHPDHKYMLVSPYKFAQDQRADRALPEGTLR
ncbi:MAG TPA: hypothetical protein VFY40_23540 [Blastocatellia bacterium]|nr:hypothetical protein [Blastocatellia bacterium]